MLLTPEYHENWPKQGILFCDVMPVLRDPITFEILLTNIMSHIFTQTLPRLAKEGSESRINYVVGLDDDLIATGGSAAAAGSLVRQMGSKVAEYVFVVSIPALKGASSLDAPEYQ